MMMDVQYFRVLTVAFTLTAVAAVGAVQDEPKKSDDAKQVAPEQDAKPLVERPISVTLIEAGKEPHRTLRYNVKPGDTQTFVVAHRNTSTQVVLGMTTPPTRDPEFRTTVEGRVMEVADGGAITVMLQFVETDAIAIGKAPAPSVSHRRGMESMHGKSAALTMNNRGVIQSLIFDSGISSARGFLIGAPHEIIEQTLRTAMVALPEEPIGVGAKWRVEESRVENGIHIERSVKYTITAMKDEHIEVTSEVTTRADPQPLESEMRQPVKLNSYSGVAKGSEVFGLKQLMPTKLDREGTTDLEIQIGQHRMTQNIESVSRISAPVTNEDAEAGGTTPVDP